MRIDTRSRDRIPASEVAPLILQARTRLQLTQIDFARKIGMSTSTVTRWEWGDGTVPKATADKIRQLATKG
jgi:DNA-binding transcriptional regulator YiaG